MANRPCIERELERRDAAPQQRQLQPFQQPQRRTAPPHSGRGATIASQHRHMVRQQQPRRVGRAGGAPNEKGVEMRRFGAVHEPRQTDRRTLIVCASAAVPSPALGSGAFTGGQYLQSLGSTQRYDRYVGPSRQNSCAHDLHAQSVLRQPSVVFGAACHNHSGRSISVNATRRRGGGPSPALRMAIIDAATSPSSGHEPTLPSGTDSQICEGVRRVVRCGRLRLRTSQHPKARTVRYTVWLPYPASAAPTRRVRQLVAG